MNYRMDDERRLDRPLKNGKKRLPRPPKRELTALPVCCRCRGEGEDNDGIPCVPCDGAGVIGYGE